MIRALCLLAAATIVLAGCGDTTGERTVTGAGIGAGAGAALGAITGMGPLTGAIAGAAVGGVVGMVTDKDQVDLGSAPVEQQENAAQSQPAEDKTAANAQPAGGTQQQANVRPAAGPQQQAYAPANSETIRSIQAGLAKLGFDPGPADGIAGTKTRSAISAFQQQNGLAPDGVPSQELAQRINQQIAARGR